MNGLLNSPYDRDSEGDLILKGKPSPRPRDAATLILVRRDASTPRVLMGKRASGQAFMPDKYVFPGGRVDPEDSRVVCYSELSPVTDAHLRQAAKRAPRAIALTAIRETYEETGLLIGRSAEMPARAPKGWQALYDLDIAPDLAPLKMIGRAITPPLRPRRFDARFFMAEAEEVLIDARPPANGPELHDLQWVSLSDAQALDLPSITRFMLGEVAERLKRGEDHKPPFVRWSRSGQKLSRL